MAMRAIYTVAVVLCLSAGAIDDGSAPPTCAAGSASPECAPHEEHSLLQGPPAQQLVQTESADWPARVSGAMESVKFTLPNVPLQNVTRRIAGGVGNATGRIAGGVGNVTGRIAGGVGNVTGRIADIVHLPGHNSDVNTSGQRRLGAYVSTAVAASAVLAVGFALHSYLTTASTLAVTE